MAALPENYRVYEHLKFKHSDKDDTATKIGKTHAGGGNDRQDAYLYGHPLGRKKRYRSPAEFFPHLLWLATDESGDPDNCSCKFCSPEELGKDEKPAPTKPVAKDVRQDPLSKQMEPAPRSTSKASTQQQQQAQQTNLTWQRPYQRPSQSLPAYSQPAPLPRFKTMEQKKDQSAGKLIYRAGEVVWFCRSHDAWGLGAVVKCDVSQNQYRVQPLSHPYQHTQVMAQTPDLLRPWLAWSPPPFTSSQLNPTPQNGNRTYTYENIDWPAFLRGQYGGDGDAEVDASILAVKAVECTFTPFDSQSAANGETHYNGIFIGAEKFWVGDPVRLRSGTLLTDIMVLHDIIEQANPHDPSRPRIILAGQSYTFRPKGRPGKDAAPATGGANNDLHLPARVREDLRFRNNITSKMPHPAQRSEHTWVLSNPAARLDIRDIRGRWYESAIMMPLLDAQSFANKCAQGDIPHAGLFMNNQGACNGRSVGKDARAADVKKVKREEAFGASVPRGFKISKGLDEVKRESGGGAEMKRQGSGSGSGQGRAPAQSQAQQQRGQPAVRDVKVEDAPRAQYQNTQQAQQPKQQPYLQPQPQAQDPGQQQFQRQQPQQQQQQQAYKQSPSPFPQYPYNQPSSDQQPHQQQPQNQQQYQDLHPHQIHQTHQNQRRQQQQQQAYPDPTNYSAGGPLGSLGATAGGLEGTAFENYMNGGEEMDGFFGFGNDYGT